MKRLLMALVVLTGLIGAGGAVWAQDLTRISQVNGMIYPLSRCFHYKI